MGFLRGGTNASNPPNYVGVQIQTSSEGMVLPVIYGANRTAPNLIWTDNFRKGTGGKKGGGGKGGGGKGSSSTTYYAGCILAVCEGPVSFGLIFVDNSTVTSLSALNLVSYAGDPSQTPFDCISSLPGFVPIAYRDIAYLATNSYALGSAATLPQHNFEIYGFYHGQSSPLLIDVNPAVFLHDICTNARYGLGIPPTLIGDLTQYQNYCTAMQILMSPCLDKEEQAISILQRWAQLSNSWIFWSENQLKVVPLGDVTVAANGVTYTPVTTVQYDLTYEDFITKKGEAPVTAIRSEPSKAYNWVKLDCRDRINQYSTATMEFKDETSIMKYGTFQSNSITADEICDRGVGALVAGLIGTRSAYIRNTYKFTLSYNFVLLEPGDIVSLTDPNIGLSLYPVRIRSISENDSGDLAIEAEECPSGVGTGINRGAQIVASASLPALDVDPGPVNTPAILEPPAAVTGGLAQIWIGASGGEYWGGATVYLSADDITYVPIGTISTPTPQGALVSALAVSADPDSTDTLVVDLSQSFSVLNASVTHADADAGRSLALIDTEVIAYGAVVPDARNAYSSDLSYLRRGVYDTLNSAHSVGALFSAIVPSAMLQVGLQQAYVGATLYLKLTSYNIFGSGAEDISAVTRYTYTPLGVVYSINPPSAISLVASLITQSDGTSLLTMTASWTASTGPSLGSYEVMFSTDGGTTFSVDRSLGASALSYALSPAVADTLYQARCRAISANGLAISSWDTSAVVSSGMIPRPGLVGDVQSQSLLSTTLS